MADQGMNDEAAVRLDVDLAVVFITLTGDRIPAQVKRMILNVTDELITCAIRFEVEWPVFQQILAGEWFGLLPAARSGFSEASFEEGRPVELQAF